MTLTASPTLSAPALTTRDTPVEPRDVKPTARTLRAIGHPGRMLVLLHLAQQGESCAGDLMAVTGLSQSATSQHLARLRRDGLVNTRRDGQTIHYRLASREIVPVIRAALLYTRLRREGV